MERLKPGSPKGRDVRHRNAPQYGLREGPAGRFADAARDILLIGAAWSILIATMLALQMFGFNFGFDVWPTGEFRNWIDILQGEPGFGAAKAFWALDHRNVLSAWWYIAAALSSLAGHRQ